MWERVVAAIVALMKALQPYVPTVLAYFAGKESERNGQAKKALREVRKANEAASRVSGMSRVDVLRQLKKQRRLRGVSTDNGE